MDIQNKINEYDIVIEGEPKEVTTARHKILDTFKDLIFVEEGHHYYLHGEEIPSVSSLTHKFEDHFDTEAEAEKYAQKHGETKEYWMDQWLYNSLKATTTGTRVHEFGESLGWFLNKQPQLITPSIRPQFIENKNWLLPIHPKEEAIVKFMKDLPKSYHLVLNEAKVYSGLNPIESENPTEKYCGTFDMLYYYDGDGNKEKSGFVIFDYKTNVSLIKEYNRSVGKKLHPPFIEMYQEPLSNYTIQLSCYQIPLEDIGLKVIDRKIIWLKQDGNYEKISLPNMTRTLREVL